MAEHSLLFAANIALQMRCRFCGQGLIRRPQGCSCWACCKPNSIPLMRCYCLNKQHTSTEQNSCNSTRKTWQQHSTWHKTSARHKATRCSAGLTSPQPGPKVQKASSKQSAGYAASRPVQSSGGKPGTAEVKHGPGRQSPSRSKSS